MATSVIKQTANNSGSDTGGNYCKMPDGTLLQWGTKAANGATPCAAIIDLPIAFIDTNYSVAALYNTQSGETRETAIWRESATKVWLYVNPSTGRNITWLAVGRWK